jgi:cytosine/adenosine deaminase-related metal-dependent hydrolase
VIDGSGKYAIPGLLDMHVHLFLPEPPTPTLNLLLANGVTGIREMASDCWAAAGSTKGCIEEYRQLQARIASGEIAGPDILGLTSTMVMGPTRLKLPPTAPAFITPVTAEQGRELVRYLASRGIDMIKTHDSIPDPAFIAMMEEARRLGIRVGGHVPFAAGSLGAAERGYGSIEHARDLLYDCSGYGPEYRRREAEFAEGAAGAARPANLERLTRTVAEYDQAKCVSFLGKLAHTGAFYVPTHVTREMEALADDPTYRADPHRKYILAARRKNWEADLDQTASLPAVERAALDRFFEHGLTVTGLAHRAGMPIMAGTDTSDTMIVPGFSLHRELGLLKRAGLSNMDILRAATSVPARYFKRGDLGGLAAGKRADLVLLRSNPLVDIRNSASIDTVVTGGRVRERRELDELLAEAERLAQSSGR